MVTSSQDEERARLVAEYERRREAIPADFYSLARPANLFFRHGQERALQAALAYAGLLPLAGRRVLEVGCGHGQWFASFEAFGAGRADIAGIDLDAERVEACRRQWPGADVRAGDAAALPWDEGSFDVVFQSTLFTSILDATYRSRVAGEMQRVLRPGGAILWYDFIYDNPANPNVRSIGRTELVRLFPRCSIRRWRVTLAPPLARRIVPRSWTLATMLECLRVLNTHSMAVIRPEETS
jgi:ubiquinone/menaquinone biosynthesis C-methylase UbiE